MNIWVFVQSLFHLLLQFYRIWKNSSLTKSPDTPTTDVILISSALRSTSFSNTDHLRPRILSYITSIYSPIDLRFYSLLYQQIFYIQHSFVEFIDLLQLTWYHNVWIKYTSAWKSWDKIQGYNQKTEDNLSFKETQIAVTCLATIANTFHHPRSIWSSLAQQNHINLITFIMIPFDLQGFNYLNSRTTLYWDGSIYNI